MNSIQSFRGILFGIAAGDSIGLPAEQLSQKLLYRFYRNRWKHRFFLKHGMVSDDTDLAFFAAQCLIVHPDSPGKFLNRLAWCLRGWIVGAPAGIGFATLRSIVKLWMGFSPEKSGVFSAGNGPATRAAVIGAFFADDLQRMDTYLGLSTRITHSDPKALTGSQAIAYLVAWSLKKGALHHPEKEEILTLLRGITPSDSEWQNIIEIMGNSIQSNDSVEEFAQKLGLKNGVTGYIYHTVPVVIYAWFVHYGDFENSLASVLNCGGDTDSTGALAGALAGAVVGEDGIPPAWINGICEYPRGLGKIRECADTLCSVSKDLMPGKPVRYPVPLVFIRNLFFFIVILCHIGWRMLLTIYCFCKK